MNAASSRRPARVLVLGILVQSVVVVLITVALLDALIAFSFRFPRWSPIPLPLVRYLHIRFDRNVIQVMPECAVYDASVTYTLKPGRCVFASREFSNEYRVNSLGVRDDETSLMQPQTVMLGDSLTMGWGVEQHEAFPQMFEARTGLRTLNAGISSYGTVRELRFLERIDRSALRNIVIQYTDNDALENLRFVESPTFETLTPAQYQRSVDDQARLLRYVPGKYAFNALVQLQSMLRRQLGLSQEPPPLDIDRQADVFLEVVARSPVDLSAFRVTVLSMDSAFIEAVRTKAASSGVGWIRNLSFVDASGIMSLPDALYILDDHPTALGHEAITTMLIDQLAEAGQGVDTGVPTPSGLEGRASPAQ